MTTQDQGRTPRPPRVDRRQALLDAAIALFVERGYDDVGVGDVAARAGVAHGLVSYYFGGKRGIAAEALRQVLAEVSAHQAPRPDETTVRERLEGFVGRHLEFLATFREGYLALLHGAAAAQPEVRQLLREARLEGAATVAGIVGLPQPLTPLHRVAMSSWVAVLDTCAEEVAADDTLDVATLTTWAVDVLLTSLDALPEPPA
ncbi:TetR/AcrR family transcriptional regulator [Aeromicrobium sp. CnD17-E]|uniref:TetR/AcrR family transcriptional regulator n=1 Tax=Aeromicrobium sp. CnD17-E TaxID=2954487 RepID=UPI0020981119|nr:TetR/AcrR family transcriptional regulator [Aeromicrobium sp. CnD17-E]MCO7237820.1 TetR family transcriptional regulator [Aeromicrobium sp. CnD17-E]